MENIIRALTELKDINSAYGLSVEYIDDILREIPEAKGLHADYRKVFFWKECACEYTFGIFKKDSERGYHT